MTLPTDRPRSSGGARSAASGTSTCATTEVIPTSTDTARNIPNTGDTAVSSSATAVATRVRVASVRLSTRSPSGSRNSNPTAYPAWVTVTTTVAAPWLTPNEPAIRSSSGCE